MRFASPPIIQDWDELAARPKILEEMPARAKCVEPLQEKIFLPDSKGSILAEDDREVSDEFKRMNIIVAQPHIFFI